MSQIKIQAYSDPDKDQIIQLTIKIAKEFNFSISPTDQPDLMEIPIFYQSGLGNFWVALDGQKVVGTIALTDIGNKQCALRKLFVDINYRGNDKGVSSSLLDTLMQWSKRKNIHELYLGTRAIFLSAHRFYEKNGFKEIAKETLPKAFPINAVDSKCYVYQF